MSGRTREEIRNVRDALDQRAEQDAYASVARGG
jgi:hypothetical protein